MNTWSWEPISRCDWEVFYSPLHSVGPDLCPAPSLPTPVEPGRFLLSESPERNPSGANIPPLTSGNRDGVHEERRKLI